MFHIKFHTEWIDRLLPEGFPFPSSTLISGPGGSGKPLVASLFVSAWLKNGGTVTFLLINSDQEYALKILSLFGIDEQTYAGKIYFIDFSPEIETLQEMDSNSLQANILKPDIWDRALALARQKLGAKEPGNLLYGAALNLLLFSNTYRDDVVEKLRTALLKDNCIFSVSTNVFLDKIAILENAADNLMFARSEKPMKLFFKIQRMKNAPFLIDEARVPLSEKELKSLRSEAESARKHLIPIISKI